MNYENVNLERGHDRSHRVTRCLHTEEMSKNIAAAAKFAQVMASDRTGDQEASQTPDGLFSSLRGVSAQRRNGFSIGENGISGEQKSLQSSVLAQKDTVMHEIIPMSEQTRAENAASIACFGLEDSPEIPKEMPRQDHIRVSGSRSLQFGSSFLRQKKEEIKARIKGNGRKLIRKIRAIFNRDVQEKDNQPISRAKLKPQQEYLLDSYGKDGAYKQMPTESLLSNSISEKA